MHWQMPPHAEIKLVRCISGAVYDVIVDLRQGSPTFLQWIGVELSAQNRRMLWVPEGFAHGFQTLVGDAEVYYQVSEFYAPEAERGARHNDPAFRIAWPLSVTTLSEKDANWPDFEPQQSAIPVQALGD
jgi:dTDP-4-dehydrorhamnose 3,5-epimerase